MRFTLLLVLLWVPAWGLANPGSVEESARHIEAALTVAAADARETGRAQRDFSSTDALLWFYAERGYAPAWEREDRLAQLVAALGSLEKDGLDPESYRLSDLRRSVAERAASPADIACVDLLATDAFLNAMQDLALGRLDPAVVEPIWPSADPAALKAQRLRVIMLAAGMLDDIDGAFSQARPSTPQYQGLRQAYVELMRLPPAAEGPIVPAGPLLREGDRDARVPLLRERLREYAPAASVHAADSEIYDAGLVAAVLAFQRARGLAADGIVGPETLAALNRPVPSRLEQLRVNLERARWLAREPMPFGVVVDIAGAQIRYVRDGETVWSARTQVGRASRPTPRLRSEVTHLTFNPSWTVPPTILRQDVLPRVREDIGYLKENRMHVLDYRGGRLDPEDVDWHNPSGILVRQEPGPHNALGQVAIRFANPFHVYLHDTPSQGIFERARRQVSSGCVRVERPMELVDLLIEDGSDAGPERAAELVAKKKTENFYLTRPVPILIGYWTADVAADGSVVFRPDIYGRDDRIAEALSRPALEARLPFGCAEDGEPS